MLAPRSLPIPIQQPTAPDLWLCSPLYGVSISAPECSLLVDYTWQSGDRDVDYYYNGPVPSGSIRLPKKDTLGTCQVAIEPAGPAHRYPQFFRQNADKMRGLAAWVIQQCAVESGSIGGFVTVGLEATESYLQSRVNDWEDDLHNASDGRVATGAFLTISINGINETNFAPGDTDPDVAGYLSKYAMYASMLFAEKSMPYQELARFLRDRALNMIRGGSRNWWGAEGLSGEQAVQGDWHVQSSTVTTGISNLPTTQTDFDAGKMTYQCDGTLGTGGPEPVDCEKLSWSGLSSDVDAEVELQKGVPRFWSEGTCTLALASTTITTTITWAHILSAFHTLNNLCIQNPIHGTKGGRAYYGRQAVSSWINGKRHKKIKRKKRINSEPEMDSELESESESGLGLELVERDSIGGVEGTLALPPGVNVTVFRNAGPGKLSCAWVLAEEGKDVGMCDGV